MWFSIHWAWLKSDGVLVQSWWWALNQTAHSHECSPASSLGSQVAPDVGGFSRDGHVCLGGVRLSQVYWHPQQRTTAICHQSGSEILPALRVWVFSSRPPAALGLKALAGVGNNPAGPLVGAAGFV